MKNICFLNGNMSKGGGTERVTSIIANELSKKKNNYKIHILSIVSSNGKSFYRLDENIEFSSIFNKSNINFKINYFKVVCAIRKYIRNNNIDILIDVDIMSDIFSIPAKIFTKTKLISWEHFNCNQNNGERLRGISRLLASKFSNCIVTLTEKDMNNYINRFKIKNKIQYIYNPIVNFPEKKCDIKSKIIISVGNLIYQKGVDMICDIAKVILSENDEWSWIILGEGNDRKLLEEKIKEYELENKLILKGNVSDVENYYINSSIYVMTSRYEGLPMVLLEAKSFALPIISFDCETGPSEIVNDGINGYLIEPNNIDSMILKINDLIKNDLKRSEFSKNSNRGLEKFDLNKIIDKWEELFNNV